MQRRRRDGRIGIWLVGEKHHDVAVVTLEGDLDKGEVGVDANLAIIPHEVDILPTRAERAQIHAAPIDVLAREKLAHPDCISRRCCDNRLAPG